MSPEEFHGLNEYINYCSWKSWCLLKGYVKVDCYLCAYIQQIHPRLMNASDLFIGTGEKNNRTKVNLDLYNTTFFFFPKKWKGIEIDTCTIIHWWMLGPNSLILLTRDWEFWIVFNPTFFRHCEVCCIVSTQCCCTLIMGVPVVLKRSVS